MKKIFGKAGTLLFSILTVMFASGLAVANTPKLTPNVNDTWHVHVSTLKSSVTFYSVSQYKSVSLGLTRIAEATTGFINSTVHYIGEHIYHAVQWFAYKQGLIAFADTIDIDDVVSEYGAHYVDEGQNMDRVKRLLFDGDQGSTISYFRNITVAGDQYKSILAQHDEVLQGFQKGFVTKGTPTFSPHTTNLYKLMVDKSIYPDEFWPSYLGFIEQLEIPERENWPFIRWYIEMLLVPKAKEDYENQVAWIGEYSAPTANVAQDASDSADGLGATREDLIDSGRITPITTGALSTTGATFVGQVEAFVDDIDSKYRSRIDYLFMSEENALLFTRAADEKYNTNYAKIGDPARINGVPNIKVIGLKSMGTSDVLWATTPENRIRPVSKADFSNSFRVSARNNKEVIISWSARMGLGWEVPELVFTNDQETSVFS